MNSSSRYLFALMVLTCLLWSARTEAAITFSGGHVVTAGSVGGGGFSTSDVDLTGDNLLVCFVAFDNGASDPTISDSSTHTWTGLTTYQPTAANPKIKIYYAQNATGSATHNFTLTHASAFASMTCAGFAGAATSSVFDQQNGAGSASVTNISTGSITPTNNDQLIVSMASAGAGDGDPTVSESMTALSGIAFDAGNHYPQKTAYKIQTTATAINPNWDGSPTSVNRAATVASFKSTSTTTRRCLHMSMLGVGGCWEK